MFGGLTKTSSRIAIAAALGLTLGGFAFKATPAQAADLGGDCCADLEERVAELEATTVRKGNKKVSVTLSGWVVKSMNYWDDGDDRPASSSATRTPTLAPALPSPAARRSALVCRAASISPSTPGLPCFGSSANQFDDFGITAERVESGLGCRLRQHRHALFLHLHQERHVGRPELGSSEPGIGQPGGSCRHFRHRDRIERRCGSRARASFCGLKATATVGNGRAQSGLTWGNFVRCQGLGAGIGVDCLGACAASGPLQLADLGRLQVRGLLRQNQLTGGPGTCSTARR